MCVVYNHLITVAGSARLVKYSHFVGHHPMSRLTAESGSGTSARSLAVTSRS